MGKLSKILSIILSILVLITIWIFFFWKGMFTYNISKSYNEYEDFFWSNNSLSVEEIMNMYNVQEIDLMEIRENFWTWNKVNIEITGNKNLIKFKDEYDIQNERDFSTITGLSINIKVWNIENTWFFDKKYIDPAYLYFNNKLDIWDNSCVWIQSPYSNFFAWKIDPSKNCYTIIKKDNVFKQLILQNNDLYYYIIIDWELNSWANIWLTVYDTLVHWAISKW